MFTQGFREIVRRYRAVFSAAWKIRHQLEPESRTREEQEFLPSTLALRDSPVHPAPHLILATIMTLLVVALVWACFGKVDVIATAPGKIIPSGDVKDIQSQYTAVVSAIHVKDGQHVKKGEALIDLDATDSIADAQRAQSDLYATRDELARARAMIDAIDKHHLPSLSPSAQLGRPSTVEIENTILQGEYEDYRKNVDKLQADIVQARASLQETVDEIRKYESTLPIEEQKEKDYAELISKGYVGKHQYYDEQQAVIQIRQNLAMQREKRLEIKAALNAAVQRRDAYIANVRQTWLEKIHSDSQKADGLVTDLAKADQTRRLMHLTAPVAGTIQQLRVHTIGGVVTPAETLVKVVPDNRLLLVKAVVNNLDIGFIAKGQHAKIKVETFPFTRYGTINGTVLQVSNDATNDKKLGLIFTAELAMARSTMQVDNRTIHLTPGMAVTAEIKTGRRRVISYLLSPLIQKASNSMHER